MTVKAAPTFGVAVGFSTAVSRVDNLVDIFPRSDTWELMRMTQFGRATG